MKRGSTIFLQVVILLLGVGVLALMLIEPRVEGRNANATNFQIYFQDPFLAYAYTASIAFFVALYQGFKLLGYVRVNQVFSLQAVKAWRTIKYCSLILIGFIVGAEIFILTQSGDEDAAGSVVVGVMMIFISAVAATAAAVFEKLSQSAVDLKSENDLTV